MSMNFPNTPTNGDQTTIDGLTYQYNDGKWISISKRLLSKTITSTGTMNLENASSFKFNLNEDIPSRTVLFSNITEGSSVWRLHVSAEEGGWSFKNASYDNVTEAVGSGTESVFFKPDGTKVSSISASTLYNTSLSNNWDIGSVSSTNTRIDPSQGDPYKSMFIKPDGSILYLLSSNTRKIHAFILSTPWDITTYGSLIYNIDDDVINNSDMDGLYISPDGTKMYIAGIDNDTIYQYNLTTPWDIESVSSLISSVTVSANPVGLRFKPDGTKMFYVSDNLLHRGYEYNLTTPWDLSTASWSNNLFIINSEETNPKDIDIKPDGTKLYIIGDSGVSQYSMIYTPSITWTNSIIWEENTAPTFVAGEDSIIEFYTPDGGNTIYGVKIF